MTNMIKEEIDEAFNFAEESAFPEYKDFEKAFYLNKT